MDLHADAHGFDGHTTDLEDISEKFLVHTSDNCKTSCRWVVKGGVGRICSTDLRSSVCAAEMVEEGC